MRLWWPIAGIVVGYLVGQGMAMAQTAGAAPSGIPESIWTLMTQGPITALIAFFYYRADLERRNLQGERDALLERTLKALNDVINTSQNMASSATANNTLLGALNKSVELLAERISQWNK